MAKPRELSAAATLEVRDACLCLHVQRAARTLARTFDDTFRPLKLTHGQFSLLNALNRAEPAKIGDVATLLAMDRTTLTANLKPLARRGLIRIAIDSDDRRGRRLALSAAGRAILAKAYPRWKRAHADVERKVMALRPDALRGALRALS